MQSQTYYGAQSMLNALLIRGLDRSRIQPYLAVEPGPHGSSVAYQALCSIPDMEVRPTRFGPAITNRDAKAILRDAVTTTLPSAWSLATLVRYARANHIDIVHGGDKPRDSFYGALLARACGASSVVHLHTRCGDWMTRKTRWTLTHADAVIAVSDNVAASARSFGVAPERVFTVHNAIDLSKWDMMLDGSAVRAELGIPSSAVVFTTVARIYPGKGHAHTLRALAKVADALPEFRYLIVGDDDLGSTPGRQSYMAELKALAQNSNLADRVMFAGSRGDIAAVLAASDIFVMACEEEAFGLVYLEAMAMRKPAVGLCAGGVPEVVDHEVTGLLAAPGDIDTHAKHLLTLALHPEMRQIMGQQGRRRVERLFTPENMARKTEQVYDILRRRRSHA